LLWLRLRLLLQWLVRLPLRLRLLLKNVQLAFS
jgi:hypothetical protein